MDKENGGGEGIGRGDGRGRGGARRRGARRRGGGRGRGHNAWRGRGGRAEHLCVEFERYYMTTAQRARAQEFGDVGDMVWWTRCARGGRIIHAMLSTLDNDVGVVGRVLQRHSTTQRATKRGPPRGQNRGVRPPPNNRRVAEEEEFDRKIMEKESPDSPEMEKESPDSPDEREIIFVEDRRPGNINLLIKSSQPENEQTNRPIDSEEFLVLDSFVDKGDKNLPTNGDNLMDEGEMNEASDSEESNPSVDDLCRVIEDRNPQLTGQEMQIPRYTINENILKAVHNVQNPKPKRNKLGNPCFNCGETTHPLRECPQPRNHAEINRNRKEFLDSKSSERPVYKRYHVEEGQLYSHLVPGELSTELREALGLEDGELPGYIYRMRCLGYPPGWLEEAVVPRSGISMFDGQGQEVATPGSQNGQRKENNIKDKYDAHKLIRFPGFNVLPPPGTHDDFHYYRSPPISSNQSIEVMIERLGSQVVGGYKRKKLSFNHEHNGETSHNTESQDMEYEETAEGAELPEDNCKFVPPLPDTEDLPPPPPTDLPQTPVKKTPNTSAVSLDSSLEDLEAQKQALLSQLNDTTPNCSTPNSHIGKTKSVDLGTPILKSVSPYARLPSADKFSINICDVINFENLPDSTGKYDQLSGVLKKVRTKLSKLHSE